MTTFINILIVVFALADVFFITYAVGLNFRHVKVVDSSLASVAPKPTPTLAPSPAPAAGGTAVTTAVPAETVNSSISSQSFSDLTQTDERLQKSLKDAADAGILDPTQDKQFRPNDPVTRADFTRWMVRTRQISPLTPATPTYSDVDAKNSYFGEIEGATRDMLMQGYTVKNAPQKAFKPEQNITRQEFAVMYGTFSGKRGRAEKLSEEEIEQYLRYNPSASEYQAVTFKDVGDIDDWARKWVAVANQAGVLGQCFDVNPYSATEDKRYFHPLQMMTRAEAVNILVKLYGLQSRTVVQDAAPASSLAPMPAATAPLPNTTTTSTDASH
ncbi:MAG: S-layer homology domain-containing protein [Candidatus Obscuribacterales bacterium]|nr:S-layer homology domain-containing protein [Candidatus Obscuribacterales bacterium]